MVTRKDSRPTRWQAWMRERQPRLLVIGGKYDPSFDLGEPERYRKDVPNADVYAALVNAWWADGYKTYVKR